MATWPDVFAAGGTIAGIPYNCTTVYAEVTAASTRARTRPPSSGASWCATPIRVRRSLPAGQHLARHERHPGQPEEPGRADPAVDQRPRHRRDADLDRHGRWAGARDSTAAARSRRTASRAPITAPSSIRTTAAAPPAPTSSTRTSAPPATWPSSSALLGGEVTSGSSGSGSAVPSGATSGGADRGRRAAATSGPCVPGRQVICDCPDGGESFKTCNDDGTSYGDCDCGAAADGARAAAAPCLPSRRTRRDGAALWRSWRARSLRFGVRRRRRVAGKQAPGGA